MDLYMIVLRLLHIFGGIFWVGTAFFFVLFFDPVIRAAGPTGGTIMGRLALTKFPAAMAFASIFTVVSGILMYVRDSSGFQTNWIFTTPGIVLSIGSIAGILAFLLGLIVQMPATSRMAALQKEIQAAGGVPNPDHLKELQVLQKRTNIASRSEAVLMVITVLGMASAREFGTL